MNENKKEQLQIFKNIGILLTIAVLAITVAVRSSQAQMYWIQSIEIGVLIFSSLSILSYTMGRILSNNFALPVVKFVFFISAMPGIILYILLLFCIVMTLFNHGSKEMWEALLNYLSAVSFPSAVLSVAILLFLDDKGNKK